MATTTPKNLQLQVPEPPRLPAATVEYDSHFQEQFMNVLRLYFNRLRNFEELLSGVTGGGLLRFPYGAFHQDGNTALTAGIAGGSTTPIPVTSTDSFPAAGWILIGTEVIQYTSKTSTTFVGITRGVFGTTSASHSTGDAVTEVQGTGSPTTIGQMLFNNTDYSNSVYTTSADYSKIYFDVPGLYNIQISVQLLNFTTSEDNVTLWFRKNGVDLPATASIQQVNSKHGGTPGATILSLNVFVDVVLGDYIQLAWASDTGNTVVATAPAGTSPVHPVSPAVILTATFVSAIYP